MKKAEIHCHILFGLDDGPKTMEESLRMIRLARTQGIRRLIATPHYSHEFPDEAPKKIIYLCSELEKRARQEIDDGIRIYPGQELFYSQDIVEKLKQKKVLTLAGTEYVLVEFLPGAPYSVIYAAVRELTMAQYVPVLAHVERYGVLRKPGRAEELIRAGAFLQMNYRRIGGRWYESTTRWCRKMLKREQIHFLSTDMHNAGSRKPDTEKAERWMKRHLDRDYQRKICYGNAIRMMKDRSSWYDEEGR